MRNVTDTRSEILVPEGRPTFLAGIRFHALLAARERLVNSVDGSRIVFPPFKLINHSFPSWRSKVPRCPRSSERLSRTLSELEFSSTLLLA